MKKNAKRKKTTSEDVLPKDLQDMIGSLKALSTIHTLLQRGMFPFTEHGAIALSIQFVESLHKQVMSEALQHKDAKKSPDLNALTRTPEEQAKLDKEFMEVLENTEAQAVQQ